MLLLTWVLLYRWALYYAADKALAIGIRVFVKLAPPGSVPGFVGSIAASLANSSVSLFVFLLCAFIYAVKHCVRFDSHLGLVAVVVWFGLVWFCFVCLCVRFLQRSLLRRKRYSLCA